MCEKPSRLKTRPRLTSDRSTPKRSRTTRFKSTQRQRTTPSVSGSGPASTSCFNKSFCSSDRRGGRPVGLMSISPSGPCWLKRCAQSRSVCRSMPPSRAASVRFIPSRTAAKASKRRACAASFALAAILRRSSDPKSCRRLIAAPIPTSESIPVGRYRITPAGPAGAQAESQPFRRLVIICHANRRSGSLHRQFTCGCQLMTGAPA